MPYKKGVPRRLETQRRYRESPNGRAKMAAYREANWVRLNERNIARSKTEKGREEQRRDRERVRQDAALAQRKRDYANKYARSEKGKAAHARARARLRERLGLGPVRARLSEEERKRRRRESLKRYNASAKYKATAKRFQQSDKGRALRQATIEQRRARLAKAGGVISGEEWRMLMASFDWRCAYCERRCNALQMEHVVPICKGGRHDLANVVPACAPCNRRKHKRPVGEFLAEKGIPDSEFASRRLDAAVRAAKIRQDLASARPELELAPPGR